jgi:hypothetical protein
MPPETPPDVPESFPNYLEEGLPAQSTETLVDVQEYAAEMIEWRQRPVKKEDLPEEVGPVDDEDGGRGTVVKEKVTCGDETCHCITKGEKHGPYLYRYFREDGRLTSEYIGTA